jgi:uncharacterized membrane protein (UPF0127 family)
VRIPKLSHIWIFILLSIFVLPGQGCGSPSKGERSGEHTATEAADVNRFMHEGVLEIQDSTGQAVVSLDIEIADDDYSRERGLMYRTWLPEQAGMFFIFNKEEYRSFWMKNTRLSLDILFIDATGKINTIHAYTIPYAEASLPSKAPARYVLEVNAGFCDNHGIREGMQVSWEKLSGEVKTVSQ